MREGRLSRKSGLVMAEAVVASLPQSAAQKEALTALQEAAAVAGKAITIAHMAEALSSDENGSENSDRTPFSGFAGAVSVWCLSLFGSPFGSSSCTRYYRPWS